MRRPRILPPRFRPMRREAAEHYVLIGLLSFAASVSLTRLYLALTGYPQIGGGEFHIAHVLWGGLLLFAAALLPLILRNAWVYSGGAILGGVGVGLFIDEVGKFITLQNDYFHPVAAPIIYVFFWLTVLLLLHVRQSRLPRADAQLAHALEEIRESLDHPLTESERTTLEARLEQVVKLAQSPRSADLARTLLAFLRADDRALIPGQGTEWPVSPHGLRHALSSWCTNQRLCAMLILGLFAVGLLTLKNPAAVLLGDRLPPGLSYILGLHAGRLVSPAAAPFWAEARLFLEVGIGALFLVSALLLLMGLVRQGAALGQLALLLSLTTVNLLLFYFEQFSTIVTTVIQFLLFFGTIYYRRRLETA